MYCVKQGFKSIDTETDFFHWHPSVQLHVVCSASGVFFSVIYNFRETMASAEKNVGVSAFFNEDVNDEQIQNLKKIIELREESRICNLYFR